ncbi:hypothetical protein F6E22_14970 [Vibrio vulnificus]|nr:hypothetical protein [Vibrio vulnificus]EGQ9235837.1 hypothetical protein [Vibrio vulnificus]EGQ9328860.1 hypothetical protein [Vibrio vulnificus]EGQ9782983.1 hypothetical protein [Vibrio vulnificus]POF47669.1 hypothetical protein CRN51_17370 [Vibrio vulnificus]
MIAHITMRNMAIKQADICNTFRAAQRLLDASSRLFIGKVARRSIDSLLTLLIGVDARSFHRFRY